MTEWGRMAILLAQAVFWLGCAAITWAVAYKLWEWKP
jgi:hypothetical protein